MTVAELISELQKCDGDTKITIFDNEGIPYKIKNVQVYSGEYSMFTHIDIEPEELT